MKCWFLSCSEKKKDSKQSLVSGFSLRLSSSASRHMGIKYFFSKLGKDIKISKNEKLNSIRNKMKKP